MRLTIFSSVLRESRSRRLGTNVSHRTCHIAGSLKGCRQLAGSKRGAQRSVEDR